MKKVKDHPLFKNFPKELKNPEKFMPIQKEIDKIMYSDHNHKTVKGFVDCKRCQAKFQKKREYIKSLGFTGIEQYQMWQRIMVIIIQDKNFILK